MRYLIIPLDSRQGHLGDVVRAVYRRISPIERRGILMDLAVSLDECESIDHYQHPWLSPDLTLDEGSKVELSVVRALDVDQLRASDDGMREASELAERGAC